jgi:hypothetical protein
MPKPGRATAPDFLLRHARARPQQEQHPMPFQKGQSGNPAGRPAARIAQFAQGRAGKACLIPATVFGTHSTLG